VKREPLAPMRGKCRLASASVGAKPCDGTAGITTAPVIVHIQRRSCGALLLRKIRPIARCRQYVSMRGSSSLALEPLRIVVMAEPRALILALRVERAARPPGFGPPASDHAVI
jgi:hypothetical protein